MVCDDCEKKLHRGICMDTWKDGSRSATYGKEKDSGRRLGENKLLGAKTKRFGKMTGKGTYDAFGNVLSSTYKRCQICKGTLHANQDMYCQHCAYKQGLCTMCGKTVADTSLYAHGQMWENSRGGDKEEEVEKVIVYDPRDPRSLGAPAPSGPARSASDATRAAKRKIEETVAEPLEVHATFGKEGSIGIEFSDEGWEVKSMVEGSQAFAQASALTSALRPGLFLTHVQDKSIAPEGVALDHDGVVGMIVGAGRPIKLSFSDVSPAAPAATATEGAEAAEDAPPVPARPSKSEKKKKRAKAEAAATAQAAKSAAEQAASSSFVYDKARDLYYDPSTQYFYDSHTQTYLKYDAAGDAGKPCYTHYHAEREEWVKYDRKEVYEEICRAGVTSGASAAAELCLAAVEAEPSGKDGRFSTWNDKFEEAMDDGLYDPKGERTE